MSLSVFFEKFLTNDLVLLYFATDLRPWQPNLTAIPKPHIPPRAFLIFIIIIFF